MVRTDGRTCEQLRSIEILPHFIKHPEGSVLISAGDTRVVCTASVEDRVPAWMKGQGRGWVSSEYGMLPRSTNTRVQREVNRGHPSGRTQEIQRLIGRSLRSVTRLEQLGERTIWIDCDVLQADGGTRTAAITGSFVALALAIDRLMKNRQLAAAPLADFVAAVSVGIVAGQCCLDLNYLEDSSAEVDMNVVRTGAGAYVELQGTAEKTPFDQAQLQQLLTLASAGIDQLLAAQRKTLEIHTNLAALFPVGSR